jgi:hypothetical protein
MDIKLIDAAHDKTAVAILFDIKVDMLLSEIRGVISQQVADIISSNNYKFQHHGVNISRSQESSVMVRNIALTSDDESFLMIYLSFGENKVKDSLAESTSLPNLQENFAVSSTLDSEVTSTTDSTEIPKLRRLSDVELRNLKVYSNAEIEKGKGNEKEYRCFWNEQVKKLAKDRSISKSEIYKQINELWKIEHCCLLENESKKVQELEESIKSAEGMTSNPDWQVPKSKKTTISKNLERVREANISTQSLRETVSSLSQTLKRNQDLVSREEIKIKLKKAKSSLDSSMSELRKAQDTLRKNLGVKKALLSECLK